MKVLVLTLGALTLVASFLLNFAGAAWLQTLPLEPEMPPGVSEQFWVPLSDRAGIVLSSTQPSPDVRGILFVRMDGQWLNVHLVGDPRLRPLH